MSPDDGAVWEPEGIVRFDAARKLVNDGFECVKRPDGAGVILVDMSAAEVFRRELSREQGVHVSYTVILVKACAIALRSHPSVNSIRDGYRLINRPSADIGISVYAKHNSAPVITIQGADKKDLGQIAEELKRKIREVREGQEESLEQLQKIARFLPFKFLRKFLFRRFLRHPKVLREGPTFQITGDTRTAIDIVMPMVFATTAIMGFGGIKKRPFVVDDEVVVRPGMYLSLLGDHQVLDGFKPAMFLHEVKRLLEHPRELAE